MLKRLRSMLKQEKPWSTNPWHCQNMTILTTLQSNTEWQKRWEA